MPETLAMETPVLEEDFTGNLKSGRWEEAWRLVLKPNWVLRHDKKRILLVEIVEKIYEIGSHARLTPQMAILLAFLDGKNSLGEVKQKGAELFDQTPEQIAASLQTIFTSVGQAFGLADRTAGYKVYDPTSFIIPQSEVDTVTPRMYTPLNLVLHIADSCIRNCLYCNVQKRPTSKAEALSTAQLLDVIDQAAALNVLSIVIAGGEPFLRKDLLQLVERIHEQKMYCGISTKAYISPEVAQRLKELGIEYMQVSIDAPEAGIADFLAGSVGFFQDAIQSIKNLRSAGIQVRTNSVITPYNVKLVPQLVELLASLGVYFVSTTTPSRSLFNGAVADSLFLNHRDGKWLEDKTRILNEQYRKSGTEVKLFKYPYDHTWKQVREREKSFRERAFCGAGRIYFVLLEDGNMILCEETPVIDELIIGNVKEQSLEQVWNSPKAIEFMHPPRDRYIGTVCYDCHEYDSCHDDKGRCWRESLKAYDKIYAPAPLCPRAPQGKRIY